MNSCKTYCLCLKIPDGNKNDNDKVIGDYYDENNIMEMAMTLMMKIILAIKMMMV